MNIPQELVSDLLAAKTESNKQHRRRLPAPKAGPRGCNAQLNCILAQQDDADDVLFHAEQAVIEYIVKTGGE